MVRNDFLRKQCAKLRTDCLIHDHLASVSTSPAVKQALVRLLVYVHARTDLLSPTLLGGDPAWTRASHVMDGLTALARHHHQWLRDVDSWEPLGSTPLRQFGSLARHLLASHPVPDFMDSVWLCASSREARQKQKWFRHLGLGFGIRGTDIPLRLTKKAACHFMHAPDHYTVEQAFRWGQITGFGGNPTLVEAVIATRLGHSFEHETYWEHIVRFFVFNAERLIDRIGPIVAYLQFHKCLLPAAPPLPMRRRIVNRLLERVAKWQPPIVVNHSPRSMKWTSIGVGGLEHTESEGWQRRDWTVRELLDSSELVFEGRAMRHCVARYADRCARRESSIWSMTCYSHLGYEHVLTIEVDPIARTIVQAKGRCNGPPPPRSRSVMLRWAERQGLRIAEGV